MCTNPPTTLVPVQRRQANIQGQVDASIPAMTDRAGNVIPFNAAAVYLDAVAKGI